MAETVERRAGYPQAPIGLGEVVFSAHELRMLALASTLGCEHYGSLEFSTLLTVRS